AQIIAGMIAGGNGFNFGLLVSTNYQSPAFTTGLPIQPPAVANVNYYDTSGNFLPAKPNPSDYLQMLNNLMVLPRPPVFVTTNKLYPPDFRFYLDLNRNGLFEDSG